jgi:hypothetical protein
MAEQKGATGKTTARKSERVGASYPETHFNNPLNAGIDEWYEDGNTSKTLESPTANTIEHVGLPLHKGRYDKYYEGK